MPFYFVIWLEPDSILIISILQCGIVMQFIYSNSRMPIKILTKIQLCRFVLFAKALNCESLRCLPQTNMGNKLSCGKCSRSKFAPTLVVVGERARESFLEKAFWETEDYFEGKVEQISNCQSALYIISLNSDFKLASSVQIHWNTLHTALLYCYTADESGEELSLEAWCFICSI